MPTTQSGQFEYPEDNWAEGRMRKAGDPSEYQMAGLLDWLGLGTRGTEAKTHPAEQEKFPTKDYGAAKPMGDYPSDFDAEEARRHGIGYGSVAEPYIDQKTTKVYGEVRTSTKGKGKAATTTDTFYADSAEGRTVSQVLNAVNDKAKSANIDLTKPEFKGVRDRIGLTYTKAAMAVEANPLAKLGFDPKLIMMDVSNVKTNLSGAYRHPEKDKQGFEVGEGMYINATDPSTVVHETMHRGIRMLKERSPRAKELLDSLPDFGGNEMVVRYMMAKHMGDPEKVDPFGKEDKQRKAAIDMFENRFGKEYVKKVNEVLKIAEDEVAKKRPGGPR